MLNPSSLPKCSQWERAQEVIGMRGLRVIQTRNSAIPRIDLAGLTLLLPKEARLGAVLRRPGAGHHKLSYPSLRVQARQLSLGGSLSCGF